MNKKFLSVITTLIFVASILFPTAGVFAAGTPPVTEAPPSTYGITYEAHVQNIGWQTPAVTVTGDQIDISQVPYAGTVGDSLRMEALKLTGTNLPAGASITYEAHVQNIGWQTPAVTVTGNQNVATVSEAGTHGQSLRMEAIKITLNGLPGYEVKYEAHGQYYGWTQGPVTSVDNQDISTAPVAGTTGESLRMEALRIEIVMTDAEKAAEVAAINAVTAYEDAPITTLTEVTAAEALGVTANEKVALVAAVAENKTLTDSVTAQKVLVDVAKAELNKLVVSSVSAINSTTLEVTLSAVPTTAPALTDFTVAQSINGGTATAVTPTAISTSGAVVTLTVPTVNATAASQSVVDSVSYKTATAVAAPAFTVAALAVSSVIATGAKTLTVAFNNVANVTAADFTVNKGTVKTNIASVIVAADQKSAVIELTSKMTKGDYTVNVAQGTDPALTGTVSVLDEKVSAIDILSDKASIVDNALPAVDTATVGYKVSNQYGEDITKISGPGLIETVTGAATSGDVKADGTIQFALTSTAKVGDTITVVLVDSATGVSTSKTITLSNSAVASTITIGALYNKDGKTLTEDSDLNVDSFYLPVELKDQYGNVMTSAANLTVTGLTPAIATFESTLSKVTINGVEVNAIKVATKVAAGDAKVLLISNGSGANATGTATVAPGLKIDTATITTPDTLVTAAKETFFPLTITDNAGNQITTLKAYKDLGTAKALIFNIGAEVKEVNGALYVSVPADQVVADRALTLVVTTNAGKVSTQTVIPKAEAVPTVITGISSKLATSLRNNTDSTNKITVLPTDLVIEDQYGQIIASTDIPPNTTINAETKLTADTVSPFDITVVGGGSSVVITFNDAPTATATSDTITYTISSATTLAARTASAYSKVYTIVKDANFASYSVDAVTPVYVDKDSKTITTTPTFVVKATSKSGEVVTLLPAEYNVVGLPAINSTLTFSDTIDTIVKTATITINATGDVLTTPVTYSTVTSAAQKFVVVDTNDKAVTAVSTDAATEFDFADLAALAKFKTTDQYGIDTPLTKTLDVDAVTYTVASGKATFSKNGTQTASVLTADAGTILNATVKVDTKTVTVQVTFESAVAPNQEQVAPTGLLGVAPTSALTDGTITGTTTAMQYKLASAADSTYATCSATETTVAAAGDYLVRLAAKTGFNAGATAAVTVAAYVAPNQEQVAPTETLAGVAPTPFGGINGTITGTTTAMEYKLSTAGTYTAVTGTSITGLAAGTYQVRYAAKAGFNAGATVNVVVAAGAVTNQLAADIAIPGLAGNAVTGVTVAEADGAITITNALAVTAGAVTGTAKTELDAQVPGIGGDPTKGYVGYTVNAPKNGELTKVVAYSDGTVISGGADVKDNAGLTDAKGYVMYYQAIATKVGTNWTPYTFAAKTATLVWYYVDGSIEATTWTIS